MPKRTFPVLWIALVVCWASVGAAQVSVLPIDTGSVAQAKNSQPASGAQRIPASVAIYTPGASAVSLASAPNQIATPELVGWLTQMIHDNLPPTYEDNRKWGKQREVWDGVKIWREAGRLETKRRKKLVNAGTWTKYKISLVEPEKRLHVQFDRLEPQPGGKIAFKVTVDSTLDVFGRLSQWARNVQLISISANADAACRLTLEGTVAFQMNLLKLPPDIAIRPHVDFARVDLTYYRVRRISQIGGDFAKVLGKGLRRVVDEKLEDMNKKLVGKINKQLEKHTEKLEFSPQDWLKSRLPLPQTTSAAAATPAPALATEDSIVR